MTRNEYYRNWYQKHKDYSKMWYYQHNTHHFMRVDDEVKRRKYRFIKEYEHFILLERLDNHCRECFTRDEVKQLEVINEL